MAFNSVNSNVINVAQRMTVPAINGVSTINGQHYPPSQTPALFQLSFHGDIAGIGGLVLDISDTNAAYYKLVLDGVRNTSSGQVLLNFSNETGVYPGGYYGVVSYTDPDGNNVVWKVVNGGAGILTTGSALDWTGYSINTDINIYNANATDLFPYLSGNTCFYDGILQTGYAAQACTGMFGAKKINVVCSMGIFTRGSIRLYKVMKQ